MTNPLEWLAHFGYLPTLPRLGLIGKKLLNLLPDALLSHVFKDFQARHGLSLTGWADPATMEVMERPRCGCPDILAISEPDAMPAIWRRKSLTWKVESFLPTAIMGRDVQDAVFAEVFGPNGSWAQHLELTFTRVTPDRPADIRIFCSPIDGPGKVLAQAQLADGRDSPRWIQVDSTEQRWGTVPGSPEANLEGTLDHELGHDIGLLHDPSPKNLMYAFANSWIVDPQTGDIEAAVRAGYQRRTATPPPPPPPPGGKKILRIELDGDATGARILDLTPA